MKGISKLAWFGLALNICYLSGIGYIIAHSGEFYDNLKSFAQDGVDFLRFMSVPFLISVLLQLLSLPILFKKPKLGLTLAIIGSLAILPLSIIFLIGYVISYERFCNRNLDILSQNEKDKLSHVLMFKSSMFYVQGAISLALGLFVLANGGSVGGLFLCTGILFFSNAIRLKQRIMIGVLNDKLVITPALYAETYLIPMKNVTLIKENKALFKLHLNCAGVDRKCSFSKKMIAGEDAQKILADILSTLPTADNKAMADRNTSV